MSQNQLQGKTALVTGGTSGLGKAIAVGLAQLGAEVIVTGRDRARGEQTCSEIQAGGGQPGFLSGDLLTQAGVRQIAADFSAKYNNLHILVNNAGLVPERRELTVDGVESTLAIHVIAPLLLTLELFPVLRTSGKSGMSARVMNTSAGTHEFGHPDPSDLNAERSYSPMSTYNTAKAVMLMVGYELAQRFAAQPITINAVDPGGVRTSLFKSAPVPWYMRPIMPLIWTFVAKPPEVAAQTFLNVASLPQYEGATGKYYSNLKERRSARFTYNPALGSQLLDACLRIAHTTLPV